MGNNEVNPTDFATHAHKQWLLWKAIKYLLDSPEYFHASRNADPDEMVKFSKLLYKADLEGMKAWVAKQNDSEIEFWSYRRLRERAKNLNIPRWSRLEKEELIIKIKLKESKQNARRVRADSDADEGFGTSS